MTEQQPDIPRVIVAQRVIDKILRGALLYPEPETGEAMIGLVVPQTGRAEPDIYVLDTISPGEQAVREWGMFEQGDDWQADVFNWLYANWEAFRELRRPSYGSGLAAKWDVSLTHVGDWHKHPGDMIVPSGGDVQTARRMIADAETPVEHIVAPIVTLYRLSADKEAEAGEDATPASEDTGDSVEEIGEEAPEETKESLADVLPPASDRALIKHLPDQEWVVRIDFWYMSKRLKRFVELRPVVWDDERLPTLPPVAWHLAHPHRFDQERDLLLENEYVIDVVRWDADGRPPYEICFSVYKPGTTRVIILVTSADYPVQRPAVRVAPLVNVTEDEDVFEKLYEASEPVLATQMPDWTWDSKRTLVELVWHIEQSLAEGSKI